MRKTLITSAIIFTSLISYSQIVFNKIIEDSIKAHIMSSVISLDTGYVFLSGTDNAYSTRCFAIRHVNEFGEESWKKVFGDPILQFWEGWYGNFKKSDTIYYLAGKIVNPVESTMGIHISIFDETLELVFQNTFLIDNIFKTAFYSIKTIFDDYFIIGQIWDIDDETYKLLLLKANDSGEYIWHKCYNVNLSSHGSTVIETSDNNILIGGGSEVTHINNTRWYLIKTDTAGNIIWEKVFGRNNYPNGHIQGLIETNDSNYIACGSYPVARYGGGGGTYLWDGCLRKIDNEGNLLWEKHYRDYYLGHTGDIYLHNSISSLIQIENNLYIIGANYDCLSWKNRAYLAKLNRQGNILWKKDYYAINSDTFDQYLVSFKPTSDSGFIMAGYGDSYDWFGYDPPQQAWLVKTDSLGIDGLCYTEYPELNIDIVLPTTLNCSDTITVYAYIAGKSAPYTIETSIGQNIDSVYYPPIFVPVEIGLTHVNLEWDNTTYFEQTITEATLSNHEWGQCIAKPIEFYTPNNAGWQQIQITVTDAYGETKTITKEVFVNDNCSNNITEENINGIYLYPNPIKDKLFIDIPQNINPIYAEIYNSLGQLIKSNNVHTGLNVINVSELTSGIYIIKITTNTEKFSLNFEKE